MFVFLGLGNPGKDYVRSPHNAGFLCIDRLCESWGGRMKRRSGTLEHGKLSLDGVPLVLAKPLTYMNDSGRAVHALRSLYRFEWHEMVVIYDDIDLPLGEVRLRASGSAGTHKGMKSVLAATGSPDFPRLRIGIDQPGRSRDIIHYVLTPLRGDSWAGLQIAVGRAADAANAIVRSGIVDTMNTYNRRANSLLTGQTGGLNIHKEDT